MTVEDETVIQDGLGHIVGQSFVVFYSDDGLMVPRDPEWLQRSLSALLRMF